MPPRPDERLAFGHGENQSGGIIEHQVDRALRQQVTVALDRDVFDRLEPLGPQQFLGYPCGRDAGDVERIPAEPDACRLGRRLGRKCRARVAKQTGACCRQSLFDESASPDHAFSSFPT
jgi:hypothetical protein